MPAHPPPRFRANPHFRRLPAGTRMWRVHDRRYAATDFNPKQADVNFGGGRFDGTELDPYPVYYAGLEAATALTEKFLRDIPYGNNKVRMIKRVGVRGQRASAVETTRELTLVDLCSAEGLAAVAQDSWLVQAEPPDYHATRRWAAWIRDGAPAAHGLIWPSKRLQGRHTLVLFGDRCPDGRLPAEPTWGQDLDDLDGAKWINYLLAPVGARIAEPRSSRVITH